MAPYNCKAGSYRIHQVDVLLKKLSNAALVFLSLINSLNSLATQSADVDEIHLA